MDGYSIAWYLWIGWFLIEEGYALWHRDTNATLSGHVWAWFSVRGKGRLWRLRRFGLLAFLAWLTVHFMSGGRVV